MPEAFGRYQLLTKLATGGMAEIWLARQQGLEGFQKLLVIKRILPHLSGNEEFVKMFLDEARIAARLNHANVVQIFDLGAQDSHYFIAMEYLHGEDARRVWKQAEKQGKPLPLHLACRIVMDACSGLDYAHKKTDESGKPLGIVHRDVSPQNLIVTFEGGVKVVDFGIAKAADQSSVTRSGVVKGKYSYMSPEQASGKKVDARTDQFALGIILYELVTGERLFKRTTEIETLRAVERCQVMPPSQVNARVPGSLDEVILRALAKDPAQRYPDCLAFQLAIEGWLVQNRLPSSSAQLASFLSEIYAERLAEERRVGHPLWDEGARPSDTGPFAQGELREPSNPTAVGKRSSSISKSGRTPLGAPPPLALAVGFDIPSSNEPSKPGPPVAGESSVKAARPSSRNQLRPALAVDDGATVSEQQTLSTTTGSIPARVARARARRSLWLGAGTGAAVVVLGGLGLVLLTSRPTAVAPVEHPATATPQPHPQPAARTVNVSVATEPSGAEVSIDGVDRGKSPLAPQAFDVGSTLEISAALPGYESAHLAYAVGRDDAVLLKLTKVKPLAPVAAAPARATLVLESKIPLVATLDGRPVRVPAREQIPAGRHKVAVSSAALDYYQELEPNLRGGEVYAPRVSPGIGKLQVVVSHQGYGDVYVGRVKHGQAPLPAFELAEGQHTVVLKNPDLKKSLTQVVSVSAGKTTTATFDFTE